MKRLVLAAVALAYSVLAFASQAVDPPEAVITKMTDRVLVEAAQSNGATDAAKVRGLVETIILPNVDFTAMTSRAVGVRWRTASDAQKAQLMAGFQSLLVKTYVGAFDKASGARFKISRVVAVDTQTSDVRGEVMAAGSSQPIALIYRMSLEDGAWKVADLSVAGVWLVPAYRSQFAQVLQNGDVDTLIHALQEKSGGSRAVN